MTNQWLMDMLRTDVNRSDKESSSYQMWINRGLRELQDIRSWPAMRTRATVTINNGNSSGAMPERFKELCPEYPCVTIGDVPCEVTSREKVVGLPMTSAFPAVTRPRTSGVPVWLDMLDGEWTLNIGGTANEALNFKVTCYRYFPDLSASTDTNWLVQNHLTLVVNAIKAVAFQELNDPIAATFIQLRDTDPGWHIAERRRLQGRVLRMGG